MLSHTVARRYAKGLLDAVLAVEPGKEAGVKEELGALREAVAGHDTLRLLIMNPAISSQHKTAILGKISETLGLSALVRRFVDVVAEKERLDHLALITEVYGDLVDQHLGVVQAEITTATPLNPGQIAELESSLSGATGGQVRISRKTDPRLVAGAVTRIGDVVYDGSAKGHLARIRERLEST